MELGWAYLLLGLLPFLAVAALMGIIALRMFLFLTIIKVTQGRGKSPRTALSLLVVGFGNVAVGLISQQWGLTKFLSAGPIHTVASSINVGQIVLGAALVLLTLSLPKSGPSARVASP